MLQYLQQCIHSMKFTHNAMRGTYWITRQNRRSNHLLFFLFWKDRDSFVPDIPNCKWSILETTIHIMKCGSDKYVSSISLLRTVFKCRVVCIIFIPPLKQTILLPLPLFPCEFNPQVSHYYAQNDECEWGQSNHSSCVPLIERRLEYIQMTRGEQVILVHKPFVAWVAITCAKYLVWIEYVALTKPRIMKGCLAVLSTNPSTLLVIIWSLAVACTLIGERANSSWSFVSQCIEANHATWILFKNTYFSLVTCL